MQSVDHLIKTLQAQGITDPRVLAALAKVPRHKFVLASQKNRAYDNSALPIDCEQTISQPYIVGLMTQLIMDHPHPTKILEIGTGSGYQTAILATLFPHIWTIERIGELQEKAKTILNELGFNNIDFLIGDGAKGWQEHAPFDAIMVTAAAQKLPDELLKQLNPDSGILVIPIGGQHQTQKLTLVRRHQEQFEMSVIEHVVFVPLITDK